MKYTSKDSNDVIEAVIVEVNGCQYRRQQFKEDNAPAIWQQKVLGMRGYEWENLPPSSCGGLEANWLKVHGIPPESASPKTVKVRVGITINNAGEWCACGGDDFSDEQVYRRLACAEPTQFCWLTAELPIPQAVELPATVTPS